MPARHLERQLEPDPNVSAGSEPGLEVRGRRPTSKPERGENMLHRVVLEREKRFADIVLEFVSDTNVDWPDLIEVSSTSELTRVRLRVHEAELETLAVALDSAYTGGDGELYFRGPG
jgi:hypothetical protein